MYFSLPMFVDVHSITDGIVGEDCAPVASESPKSKDSIAVWWRKKPTFPWSGEGLPLESKLSLQNLAHSSRHKWTSRNFQVHRRNTSKGHLFQPGMSANNSANIRNFELINRST